MIPTKSVRPTSRTMSLCGTVLALTLIASAGCGGAKGMDAADRPAPSTRSADCVEQFVGLANSDDVVAAAKASLNNGTEFDDSVFDSLSKCDATFDSMSDSATEAMLARINPDVQEALGNAARTTFTATGSRIGG